MSALHVLAVTARTASILVAPDGTGFVLKRPIEWVLGSANGAVACSGTATAAAVFIDGLEPDRTYLFACPLGTVPVRTPACAGLVDGTEFGIHETNPNNALALCDAVAAVPDGGTLWLGAGHYRTGPVFLKPNMTLHLDHGATLAAIGDRADWPQLRARDDEGRVLGTWEGLPEASFAALITAVDCHDLAITGRGVVDGGGDRGDWWTWPKERRDGARRPRTIHIAHSADVSITGVSVRNSPSWTVHPYRCTRLHVSAVRIENPPDSPNTDGLNPESCEDVEITGVDFSVGDDCIAIKSGKRGPGSNDHLAPTRNVRISHCHMKRGHGAVVLGSEMSGGISGVTISDCEFDETDRGLRLKTRRGRGGIVENVAMRDVVMRKVPTPLAINAFYFCDPDGEDDWVQNRAPAPVDETTPVIRAITLERVRAEGVRLAAAAILGLPEAPVDDVRIADFAVSYDPDAEAEVPLMALGVAPIRHGGLLSQFAHVAGEVREISSEKDTTPC